MVAILKLKTINKRRFHHLQKFPK